MSISRTIQGSPGRKVFFREAIGLALAEAMREDDRVFLLGQDIGSYGGPYKETAGLFEEFGQERVRDTPVAEASQVGVAVGAAAAGMRPVAFITYMDFLTLGLDPLVNYAAKIRYKTGGQLSAPLVVKTTAGAKGQGVAHSQCFESWLMNVPGLKVVAPSTPADAYDLLKAAIRDDGPVVYVDHKRLFPTNGPLPEVGCAVPPGKACLRRSGGDITIATFSFMTHVVLEAAKRLELDSIHSDVLDLRSLSPIDIETICESVRKTRALLTVEEGQVICGVGSEIAFQVRENMDHVRLARAGARRAPISANPKFEAYCLPSPDQIVAAAKSLLSGPVVKI